MRRFVRVRALAAALVAAGGCAEEALPLLPSAPTEVPRERIDARFPGQSVGVAAQVKRGEFRAAIVWPILEGGGFVDDEVVAAAFVRGGRERWRPHGLPVKVSGEDGRAVLRELLGGDDRVVERRCGLPRESLVDHVRGQIAAFRAAIERGDPGAAIVAYEELCRAFAFDLVAFDDMLPEWLIAATQEEGFELAFREGDNGEWYSLEVRIGEGVERGTLPLVRCGEGWVFGRPFEG